MFLNLSKPKPVLEPNPESDRLTAADCFIARDTWLTKATTTDDPVSQTLMLNKAAMYEDMAFDGRK